MSDDAEQRHHTAPSGVTPVHFATGGYIPPRRCCTEPCDHVPAFLSEGCVYPASMVERHGADLLAALNTPANVEADDDEL